MRKNNRVKKYQDTTTDRLKEWWLLLDTVEHLEDPTVEAGRQAETFLQTLVETNLKYKGAYCFLGKRVYSHKFKRRFEIDLIVLTKKHIYFLEVKNWSGQVVRKDNEWLQIRTNGEIIRHPDLTKYNSQKQKALISFLKGNHIDLKQKYFSQKVIFMNPNLQLAPDIFKNPDVIPFQHLQDYLRTQKGVSVSERVIHSIIDICLESEKSAIIIDGLFGAMNKNMFNRTQKLLSGLETWDKVVLHGGRVVTGDLLKLYTATKNIDLKRLPSGTKCKVSWNRSKVLGLAQALLTKKSLGTIKLPNEKLSISPSDTIKFHFAGEPSPSIISVKDIEMVIRG